MPVIIGNLDMVNRNRSLRGFIKRTYSSGTQFPIRLAIIDIIPLGPLDINYTVDDRMRNVHALRTKFPRQALAQSPQRKLAARKRSALGTSPDRRRRAREQQRGWVRRALYRIEQQRKRLRCEIV